MLKNNLNESRMIMLFRIEDISGDNNIARNYCCSLDDTYDVNKTEIDAVIASMIRNEINGSDNRILHSYSKSLATCLFKYNNYDDNELHLLCNQYIDAIYILNQNNIITPINYSILNRINGEQFEIPYLSHNKLISFAIDVSNNTELDTYLRKFTGVGRKKVASPQKDNEVVVLNPLSDLCIHNYMNGIYLLYSFQLKYNFLNYTDIKWLLINKVKELDDSRFDCQENHAIISIINYLSQYWHYERNMSNAILVDAINKEHPSLCYDSHCKFYDIQTKPFDEIYNSLADYSEDYLSNIVLNCMLRFAGSGGAKYYD